VAFESGPSCTSTSNQQFHLDAEGAVNTGQGQVTPNVLSDTTPEFFGQEDEFLAADRGTLFDSTEVVVKRSEPDVTAPCSH
jgi:hypothetical protein